MSVYLTVLGHAWYSKRRREKRRIANYNDNKYSRITFACVSKLIVDKQKLLDYSLTCIALRYRQENFKVNHLLLRISRIHLNNRYRSGFHRTRKFHCFSYSNIEGSKIATDIEK